MGNTLFVTLFICNSDYSHQACESIITYVFEWLPQLSMIGYLVNDSYELASPLTELKLKNDADDQNNRKKKKSGKNARYFTQIVQKKDRKSKLWVCSRNDFTKTFRIRKSRVEDCDDIAPMLMKQNNVKKIF